jgi:DNA-binding NarL/FixJ family response regulator
VDAGAAVVPDGRAGNALGPVAVTTGRPVNGSAGRLRRAEEDRPVNGARRSDELDVLTDRERQVLELVADGRTNQEIAEKLFISARTVGVHVSHILEKLHVRSRVDATRVYERNRPRP